MSGFILTSQMLRDKKACDQWQKIFDFRCPNGLPLNDTEDLVRAIKLGGFGPVVRWFLEYFPEESEHLKIEGKLDLAGANLARAKNLTSDQIKSAYHNHYALIAELTASSR